MSVDRGPADLQHWSAEVARDPDSLAFLPLARAYRRLGRQQAALRLLLRGLERYPTHVEAHALLAMLHLDRGEREDARDAWATVLRLDPASFEANRGMGFFELEAGDLAAARRHLEAALAQRPTDRAVLEAIDLLRVRQQQPAAAQAGAGTVAGATEPGNPVRLFDALHAETPFLGAVILDARGLVLAGRIGDDAAKGELLGAVLGTAVQEAMRTAELLELNEWRGMLLETEEALLHMGRLAEGEFLLLAVGRGTPAGWVLRAAGRAAVIGRRFLEER